MSREVSGGLLVNWTVLSIGCRFPRSKMSSDNQSVIKQTKVKKKRTVPVEGKRNKTKLNALKSLPLRDIFVILIPIKTMNLRVPKK